MTRIEIVETITHLASYAGWPTAGTAVGVFRKVLAEIDHEPTQQPTNEGASNADA